MGNRLKEAYEYASEMHKGKKRKGSTIDYIVHPERVYEIVKAISDDEDVQIAALLHDVIEDTKATEEDIEEKFGTRVLNIVLEVSTSKEDKKEKSWLRRKTDTVIAIYKQSEEAQIVEVTDKLANAEDFYLLHDENGVIHFDSFKEKDVEKQEWYYRKLYEAFRDSAKNEEIKEVAERLRECTDFGFGECYEEYVSKQENERKDSMTEMAISEFRIALARNGENAPLVIEAIPLLKESENFLNDVHKYLNEKGIRTSLHQCAKSLSIETLKENIKAVKTYEKQRADVVLINSGSIYKRMRLLEVYEKERLKDSACVYDILDLLNETATASESLEGAIGIYNADSDNIKLNALYGAFTNIESKIPTTNINACRLNREESIQKVVGFIADACTMNLAKSEKKEERTPQLNKTI